MSCSDLRQAYLTHTEAELAAEKAAALRRIVETLEGLLAELDVLRVRAACACPADRGRLLERHEATRQRALEYRWYLRVQCDAIGIRRHDEYDARYPEPARIA